MQIFIGADHGGFTLKEMLKAYLRDHQHTVTDCGASYLDPHDDYPEYAWAVAEATATHTPNNAVGILLCRSGGGVAIAANKVKGIRAVVARSQTEAIYAREHNHANVLVISGDWTTPEEAQVIADAFLATPYSAEERHVRRVEAISAYEADKTLHNLQ